MGRKPNQLIAEFFIRGPKLQDSSNRYEYTCRLCGEHFPKGRIESLITHLNMKCAHVSGVDRQRALLKSNDLTKYDIQASSHHNGAGHITSETYSNRASPSKRRRLTGLEALAEASRQVEYPETGAASYAREDSTLDPSLRGLSTYIRPLNDPTNLQDVLGRLSLKELVHLLIAHRFHNDNVK